MPDLEILDRPPAGRTAPRAPAQPCPRPRVRPRARSRAAVLTAVLAALGVLAAASTARAHVTPNVQLVKRGDFVRQALPAATQFLEQRLVLRAADLAAIRSRTHWTPTEEEVKIYLGRDAQGQLQGVVVFVWMPSEHGPVGIAAAIGPGARLLQAAVTDVGSEPLSWVRPLLQAGAMAALNGQPIDADPDEAKLAPGVTARMSRYYAEVVAHGVGRAEAVGQVALAAALAAR